VTLQSYATNKEVYKLPIGAISSNQYFLLSNRRKGGFDAHLPGEGLIIEHVDDNQSNNTDETHYLVDIEQCDGKFDLNKNANSGDATDPYPDGGQDKFTSATTPSSKAYDGSDSKVEVTAISDSGVNVTAKVKVGATVTTGPAWYNNRKVLQTFASADPQNAWGNIDGLGWRKVKPGAADGVINLFDMLCEAVANGRKVNVFADANEISIAYLL
ncbi:MAG: M6 family metalloprotease domain-containing protein, partial [Woeseiaceae bacterium]